MDRLRAAIVDRRDLDTFNADVLSSQARRQVVYAALRNGNYFPWDFQPLQKASERYMRNHLDLNELEESARSPLQSTGAHRDAELEPPFVADRVEQV